MRCGNGPGFDQLHMFYLDMRAHLQLCMSTTLGRKFALNWADMSIEYKHEIIAVKRDTLDTVELPPPAKKQKAMAKEVATKEVPKEKTAGTNSKAAADHSNSWTKHGKGEKGSK
ncbi:hypothetical protein FRC10_001911 [Ceratobasidium sp. 414]|nr:hypothetical protein FRC10_001911 [Ceratobasidium sp. 414]